jgi:hypothetical protein
MQHYVIMLFSELRKVDGFRWALRFPIPLSICPSIISIKEGRKGGSLLVSPTPLLLFSTRGRETGRKGVGEMRKGWEKGEKGQEKGEKGDKRRI